MWGACVRSRTPGSPFGPAPAGPLFAITGFRVGARSTREGRRCARGVLMRSPVSPTDKPTLLMVGAALAVKCERPVDVLKPRREAGAYTGPATAASNVLAAAPCGE